MKFLSDKKLFVFDMDGTVYLGNKVFPDAVRFIKKLRIEGKKVLFFTNNASHNAAFYISKLNRMGFEATEDELSAIVAQGATVADVFVRHNVYGKLEAALNIFTIPQVKQFVASVNEGESSGLMSITGGYHYHTVRAATEDILDRVEKALDDKGYLIKED